jgi:hypothetical protein
VKNGPKFTNRVSNKCAIPDRPGPDWENIQIV